MSNINLDFKEIMRTVENQFNDIIYKDSFYNGYFVTVAEEQDFNKIMDKSPMHIYIVVKFLSASINYGQILLPITITAVSEDRKLDVCKRLLFEFADRNNLRISEDFTIKQFYTSPQVISNFEEIYDGYRSLFTLSGTFLINRNANPYKYYYCSKLPKFSLDLYDAEIKSFSMEKFLLKMCDLNVHSGIVWFQNYDVGKWNVFLIEIVNNETKSTLLKENISMETYGFDIYGAVEEINEIRVEFKIDEIENLNNRSNFDVQHDSQLFFNSNNNVRSRAKSKVNVISFSTYLLKTEFINKVLAISLDDYTIAPEGENTDFVIIKEYQKVINEQGYKLKGLRHYKLASVNDESSISEFPLINITLTI